MLVSILPVIERGQSKSEMEQSWLLCMVVDSRRTELSTSIVFKVEKYFQLQGEIIFVTLFYI